MVGLEDGPIVPLQISFEVLWVILALAVHVYARHVGEPSTRRSFMNLERFNKK